MELGRAAPGLGRAVDHTIKLWDTANGLETLTLHGHTVLCAVGVVVPGWQTPGLGQLGQHDQDLGRPQRLCRGARVMEEP